MSLKSDVTLLTSGATSHPSTLGCDGKSSQENCRYWNFLLDFTSTKDSPSLRKNSDSFNPEDAEAKASTDDHDKLKPIDIKDIERPDKYDNQAAKFIN